MGETQGRELLSYEILQRVAPMIRHAAHPVRLRILDFLSASGEPRSVSEIVKATGVAQAVASQQLRVLKDQRVLTCERRGNRVLYSILNRNVLLLLECIRRHETGGCASAEEGAGL